MTNPSTADDELDKILKPFYNRVCSTAGTSFAGDPYEILSKSAKQAIAAYVAQREAQAERKAIVNELESLMTEMSQVLDQPALGDLSLFVDLRIKELER